MSRVIYLACSTIERGIADAEERGCTRLARTRFAMPNRDDLRVVRLFTEVIPMAGKTPIIQGSDYHTPPDTKDVMAQDAWLENHEEFERFVESGHGEWVG